ncbi:MAG: hypothetical protein H6709_07015 [Kofleriaceae bacterium]|nr:hypothetical protein [Myxococcales bacterium]MCB9560119.1 hypothetical protein [Kofleriaceae bacterium]MCB9571828.1 hypothetical protein [Kofleriaceae bacterium]
MIDDLVEDSLRGQGQLGPRRARAGLWNALATAEFVPEQHAINALLARLSPEEREVIAGMLFDRFTAGVHQALVALHAHEIEPFDDGYEGTPYHDFVGRLDDWPWPDELVPRRR